MGFLEVLYWVVVSVIGAAVLFGLALIASFIQEYVHCWRIDQRNKPYEFKPPPPAPPYVKVIPEGYEADGQYTYRFIGAPDHFKPEFESFESISKRMLGEEGFLKKCWDPRFVERLNIGDEVKRQVMWLFGKYETNSTADYQRNFTEASFWNGRKDGEDFVSWYNRYELELRRQTSEFSRKYEMEMKQKKASVRATRQEDFWQGR